MRAGIRIKTALQLGTLVTLTLAILVCVVLVCILFQATRAILQWETAFLMAVLLSAVALFMAYELYLVGASLGQRIASLESAVQRARTGQLDRAMTLTGEDEVAEISKVFSEMAFNLQDYVRMIPVHEQLQKDYQKLNDVVRNLHQRNIEVSDSLQRLRRAQIQLLQRERAGLLSVMAGALVFDVQGALDNILHIVEQLSGHTGEVPALAQPIATLYAAVAEAQAKTRRVADVCRSTGSEAFAPTDLRETAEEAVALTESRWKQEAEQRGVSIQVNDELEPGLLVNGRHTDLVQMFTHLIHNSVEALPRGGTVRIRLLQRSASTVAVALTDDGAGMPEAVRQRCFKPFFSTKDGAGGIGLALVEAIVIAHRGRVGIESTPGSGTTAFIELPTAAGGALKTSEMEPPPLAQTARILIAEDDLWTRNVLTQSLQLDGHQLRAAENGTHARQLLGSERFDLLITDRSMPDSSGEELAAEAKQLHPGIPVILLTGYGSLMKERGVTPPHVDLVLGKPISTAELRRALNSLLSRRGAQ